MSQSKRSMRRDAVKRHGGRFESVVLAAATANTDEAWEEAFAVMGTNVTLNVAMQLRSEGVLDDEFLLTRKVAS